MMELPLGGFFALEDPCLSWGGHSMNAREGDEAVEFGGDVTVLLASPLGISWLVWCLTVADGVSRAKCTDTIPPSYPESWQGSHSLGGGGVIAVASDSCNPMDCSLPGSSLSMGFFRQEYWSGSLFPSAADLPTQRLNLRFLHCQRILYHWITRDSLVCWPNSLWGLEHITETVLVPSSVRYEGTKTSLLQNLC